MPLNRKRRLYTPHGIVPRDHTILTRTPIAPHRITCVISRYMENIKWTSHLPNVVIYNKGNPIPGHKYITLPNVGREGHTYYKYIVDNYNILSDYTVFLQGHPFDHSPNIIQDINSICIEDIQSGYKSLCSHILTCTLNGCAMHGGLPLRSVWQHLYGVSHPEPSAFEFGAGAQFIVSREAIYRHPIEFYRKIVDILGNNINPIEGYVMERLHKLIFTIPI